MRVPGVLLALPTLFSLAAAACTVGNQAAANAPPGGGGGPAGVPVTIAPVVTKSMPVELRVIGTAEASSSVAIRAQVNGELTKVHFTEGDDVQEGQVLFTLDRRPYEVVPAAGRGQPSARRRSGSQRPVAGGAAAGSRRTGHRVPRPGRCVADGGRSPRGDGGGRSGRRGKRAHATGVRDDQRADGRAHRRPHGPRGQSGPGQRYGAARRDQQAHAHQCVVRHPRVTAHHGPALPGARPAVRATRAPGDDNTPVSGRISFIDNAVDQATGTDQGQGHVSATAIGDSGRASSSTSS